MATLSSQVASASRMFLVALGAPTTDPMVKAVGAWLLAEGGHITGNNPWNLHSWGGLPGQTGYRYAGPGDKNVAVFATLQAGSTASAMNLERLAPSYGYGTVISQARAGNPVGFLDALASSSWSAGHYGGAGPNNKLRRIYASLGGAVPASAAGAAAGLAPASSSGGGITFASYTQDHLLTADDIERAIAEWKPRWIAQSGLPEPLAGIEFDRTQAPAMRAALTPYIGKPVSSIPATIGGGLVQDIASAIAGLPAALGNIGAHLVILVVIFALIVIGLKAVVGSEA